MDGAKSRSLDADELQMWAGMLEVSRRLADVVDADLQARHAISLGDFDVLARLAEAPSFRLRMTSLAETVKITPSGLSRQIDRLELRGLVERLRCPSDGRGFWAGLTKAGRELLEQARATRQSCVRRRFLGWLDADDVEQLAAIWVRLGAAWAADGEGHREPGS